MAIKALNLASTVDYVVKSDRSSERPTIFKLGTLDSRVVGLIKDMGVAFKTDTNNPDAQAETILRNSKIQFLTVQFGLIGFENFLDSNDNVINHTTEKYTLGDKTYNILSEDILKTLPGDVLVELYQEITALNQPSEDELKN